MGFSRDAKGKRLSSVTEGEERDEPGAPILYWVARWEKELAKRMEEGWLSGKEKPRVAAGGKHPWKRALALVKSS